MGNNEANTNVQTQAERNDRGTRLDKFWAARLAERGISRGRVRELIESGKAFVDGRAETRGKYKLSGSETLALDVAVNAGTGSPVPEAGDLPVIYEDEHVLVVSKPAGLTTHPAPGQPDNTLVNRLLHHYPDMGSESSGLEGQRPGIVHRLDKDTSGLMVVARTEGDRLKLSADFAGRAVSKVYLALVHGRPQNDSGDIDAPIGRHPQQKTRMAVLDKGGRDARSRYEVLWTDPAGRASLVAVRIFTGRTHQIRVHMAHIGHPLVGDATYGARNHAEWETLYGRKLPAPRQMLHAFFLRFNHPASSNPLCFVQAPPEDMLSLLGRLGHACLKVGVVGLTGCGKSTVISLLRDKNIPVFSADECVAELYEAGADGAEMMAARFGNAYNLSDGTVNKKKLFSAMLESDALRREVMDMVHPMVQHRCTDFFRQEQERILAFAEVPLLLEGGWHKKNMVDEIVFVDCPEDLRTGRFREKRGISVEMLATFDSWQWSAQQKKACCGFVIANDGGLDRLEQEVDRVVAALKKRAAKRDARHEAWLQKLWTDLARRFEGET